MPRLLTRSGLCLQGHHGGSCVPRHNCIEFLVELDYGSPVKSEGTGVREEVL